MLLDDRIEDGSMLDLRPMAARRRDAVGHGLRQPVPGPGDDLPPELDFLLAQGVAPGLLRRAARIARDSGASGEDALFGLGFPDERYARHLGAPWTQFAMSDR